MEVGAVKPFAFAVLAVACVPGVVALSALVTCAVLERVWLPRIAGED